MMVAKVENGLKAWLIRIATILLLSWSGWATAQILDLQEHKAYTRGHVEEFERTVLQRLERIEDKVDRLPQVEKR